MPAVKCPLDGCSYKTPDLDAAIVAALLTTHSISHNSTQGSTRVKKVSRPTLSSSGTSEEWQYFLSRWRDYKEATKITGKDLIIQLLECCEENLRRDLTRFDNSPTSKNESELLDIIKKFAVREENITISRVSLHDMEQDREEPIRSYYARLKGHANTCNFTIPCSSCQNKVNYSNEIIRDVLIKGISDSDIQLELFGTITPEMTLENILRIIGF